MKNSTSREMPVGSENGCLLHVVREPPRFGPLSSAPVSAKELKERAFQGVLWSEERCLLYDLGLRVYGKRLRVQIYGLWFKVEG